MSTLLTGFIGNWDTKSDVGITGLAENVPGPSYGAESSQAPSRTSPLENCYTRWTDVILWFIVRKKIYIYLYIFISRPLFSGMFKSEYKDNAYLLLTELTVKELVLRTPTTGVIRHLLSVRSQFLHQLSLPIMVNKENEMSFCSHLDPAQKTVIF